MRARSLVLLVLVVLALALGSWCLVSPEEEGAGVEEHSAATPSDDVTGPKLGGAGARGLPQPKRADEAVEATVRALPASLGAWTLTVLTKRRHEGAWIPDTGATVHAALVGPEGVLFERASLSDNTGRCGLGTMRLPDVPRRLVSAVTLRITATSEGGEGYRVLEASLSTLSGWLREAPRVRGKAHVTRTLERGARRRVAGRVLTATGHPACGVVIRLQPGLGGGMAVSDWDGGFELLLEEDVGEEVVLHIEATGTFTIHHEVALAAREELEGLVIRLSAERGIQGRVVNAAGKPLAGIHLVLTRPGWEPNREVILLYTGSYPAAWVERFKTRSAGDGTFAFPGLKPDTPYELWWPVDGDNWACLEQTVRAADHALNVVVDRHSLAPRLVDAVTGRPVFGETAVVRVPVGDERPGGPVRSWDASPTENPMIVAPGNAFRIHAWAPGFQVSVLDFTVPATPGTHAPRIALKDLPAASRVRVRFVDAEGVALGEVPHGYSRPLSDSGRSLPMQLALEAEASGWLRVRRAPPGPLLISTPDYLGTPIHGRWRFTLPHAETIVIPETGVLDKELRCPQGGAVRLVFHGPPDVELAQLGDLRLVDASGIVVLPWWFVREGAGWRELYTFLPQEEIAVGSCAYESGVLAPGAWTLEIKGTPEFRAISQALRVQAGKVTDVHVTLEEAD